jgi:hypothetical protein
VPCGDDPYAGIENQKADNGKLFEARHLLLEGLDVGQGRQDDSKKYQHKGPNEADEAVEGRRDKADPEADHHGHQSNREFNQVVRLDLFRLQLFEEIHCIHYVVYRKKIEWIREKERLVKLQSRT